MGIGQVAKSLNGVNQKFEFGGQIRQIARGFNKGVNQKIKVAGGIRQVAKNLAGVKPN